MNKTNILFILADQLCAEVLSCYGKSPIETPHISKLASGGIRFTNAISTFPVCTPYRSMLLTGRHPLSTGHLVNNVCTRHDEISNADTFSAAGYRTGWVGKWHLHRGSYPEDRASDWIPDGRDRFGFQFWRAYNQHMIYFDGPICTNVDWLTEQNSIRPWNGYETDAMAGYTREFLEGVGDDPFLLFVSPHQPHWTPRQFAPEEYYTRLPANLAPPSDSNPTHIPQDSFRHYLAMVLALDDMVGMVVADVDRLGLRENTLIIFTSDHGTQMGRHERFFWEKRSPYEESIHVPFILNHPGRLKAGGVCDILAAPTDHFPSLCGYCGIPIPSTVEGYDLSAAWEGKPHAFEQDAVLTGNISLEYGSLVNGHEWRGVRTKQFSYARWLDGKTVLYDLQADPYERNNLSGGAGHAELQGQMETRLQELLKKCGDLFEPAANYRSWFDDQRRVVRNAFGPLSHPDSLPNWDLLGTSPLETAR